MPPDSFTTAAGIIWTKVDDNTWRSDSGATITRARAAELSTSATTSSGGGSLDAPTVRNFPDGSVRQWDGDGWVTIMEPPQQAPAQDRNLGNGVFETPNGEYYVVDDVPGPGGAGGMTVRRRVITAAEAANIVDPQAPATITPYQGASLAEDRRQFDERERRLAEEARIAAEAEAARLQEQMRANKVQEEYLRDRLVMDERFNDRADARGTADLLFTIQSEGAALQQAYQQQVAQIQMFNRQEQFRVEQENQRRIEANQAARRQNALDIGNLSTEAGDRGKLASFLLANSGNVGAINEAIAGGQDFRGGEGLAALGELYNEQATLERGPSLLSFEPLPMPQQPKLDTSFLNDLLARLAMSGRESGQSDGLVNATNLTAQEAIDAGVNPRGREGFEERPATADELRRFQAARGAPDFVLRALQGQSGEETPRMEDGGVAGGVAVAGDSSDGKENEEYVFPFTMPDGTPSVVIAPKRSGGMLSSLMAMMEDPDAKFEDGGLFARTLFGDRTQSNMDLARGNLNAATNRALLGTPWEGLGRTPAPVEVSAPGTDSLAQELAAGITATGTGLPRSTFLNMLLRMMPATLETGRVSRRA